MGGTARLKQTAQRAWRSARAPLIILVIVIMVAVVVDATKPVEPSDGITAGLSALITLNAVVLALVYATTQRALVLSFRGEAGRAFFEWTGYMSLMSMVGVILGIVHLVWAPRGPVLAIGAALLVTAPGLIPVVAIQEMLARRARSADAVDTLLRQGDASNSGIGRAAGEEGTLRVRAREFNADPEAPFAGDVLGRRRIVEATCRIVTDIVSPAVISVDGGWGAGKTAFGKMCVALLRSESFRGRHSAVVEFNAWTQSHAGEPLHDLVAALTRTIGGEDEVRERLLGALDDQALKAATGGMVDPVLLKTYDSGAEAARLKELLAQFVASGGRRVVIFIDELDRCRPDHALRVLETARNLLDVVGVVVVVTVNLEALEHAVASLLGPECDADTYLRRFIDLRATLPLPQGGDLQRFYGHVLEQTGLADRLQHKDRYTWRILGALAAVHPRSLRDLEQSVCRAAVLLASVEPGHDGQAAVVIVREQTALTLLVLREADRAAYEDFVHGRIDGCDAGNALASALPQGGLGSEMVDPESLHGPPTVSLVSLHRMEALLLAVSQDGLVAGRRQDIQARYNSLGRG